MADESGRLESAHLVVSEDGASTVPVLPSRRIDSLWCAALVSAASGMFVATFAPGIPGQVLGIAGVGLGLAAFVLSLRVRNGAGRRVSLGAVVAVVASLLTTLLSGRSAEPPTIALADAPKYRVSDGEEYTFTGGTAGTTPEGLFRPGPIALSGIGLRPLAANMWRPSALVAAEWDGAWYAGRLLSVSDDAARVHFVGWDAAWDTQLPRDALRALDESQLPKPSAGANALGSTEPSPSALVVAVYQPDQGLSPDTKLEALSTEHTLYAQRLDLSNVPLATALGKVKLQPGKAFALAATAALHFDQAGTHYFSLGSNGNSRLWLDGTPVQPHLPVAVDAGVHQLRVESRHDGREPTLSLSLRSGTDPKALRVLDMQRYAVAQSVREADGRWRLVLPEALLFDLDKAELKASAERALATIFELSIAPAPAAAVAIEGHTDDRGSDAHNLELSQRRAESVRAWLVQRGRAESTLGVRAFGETRPRMPNDTEAHRKQNRRVELLVGGQAPGAAVPGNGLSATNTSTSAPPVANQAVLDVLHAYYRELNDGSFDANRYFEPAVERFITMKNTSTSAMNHYIRNAFPKQFREHHFELEEGSLSNEGAGRYAYIERSRYILAGKTQSTEKRVRVRIRVSPAGKLVFLQQFNKLE